jgi:hypothetical protein
MRLPWTPPNPGYVPSHGGASDIIPNQRRVIAKVEDLFAENGEVSMDILPRKTEINNIRACQISSAKKII